MNDEPSIARLLEEFPELCDDDVELDKELLAHFGLLFSRYALLEAAIQNIFVFWQLGVAWANREISSPEAWATRHEELEKKAHAATFGSLLKLVGECRPVQPFQTDLQSLKRKRDYFAHHFFREENANMHSDRAKLGLINEINVLRGEVASLENSMDEIGLKMFREMCPGLDIDGALSAETEKMRTEAIREGYRLGGWKHL